MLQNKPILTRTNSHNKVVFNILLWVCSFVILLFLFSGNSSPSKIDYIYTICFVITLIMPVSLTLYLLIPKYLKKEKNLVFIIFVLINIVVFSELNPWFFKLTVNTFFSDYYFISHHNTIEIYFIFFIFLMLTSLIKLGEDWVYLNQIENNILKAQKQEIEQQLYYLKGQINPHFLFNSLNVLYSLAIDKKEDITNAILQLSGILRYVIYDIEADKIPIEKEISLIQNYIEFEKNRHIKNSKISFDFKVENNFEIYPMLLLPLLENSFKHGLKSGINNPFIDIQLKIENKKLYFTISNNFKEITTNNLTDDNGIGLKNIRENLMLIYPNKHQFSIEKKEEMFTTNLTIDL